MRNYKRKTNRGKVSAEIFQQAADAVLKDGRNVRTVARELNICHTTLFRYVGKIKAGITPKVGYNSRIVFNVDQEKVLIEYLSKCSSIYFGLLPEVVKKLVYRCAVKLNSQHIPPSWHINQEAGAEWFTGFKKRHSSLSIMRSPEATSVDHSVSSSNEQDVRDFFTRLKNIILSCKYPPSIWNIDETRVTTVKPNTEINPKIAAVPTTEQETLVSVALAVSAAGATIPPMFVFPSRKFKDLFLRDAHPECIGYANGSGLMTANEFLLFMDHFITYTSPTPEDPVLLLLDNDIAHVDIDVIEKAETNSMTILCFPPNCSHYLQPLEVLVKELFETMCLTQKEIWQHYNPGKNMSTSDIPRIVKHVWPLIATPTNILDAFKKTGIAPYNPELITVEIKTENEDF